MNLLVIACIVLLPAANYAALSLTTSVTWNGVLYKGIKTTGTWHEQRVRCRSLGTRWGLAVIKTQGQMDNTRKNVLYKIALGDNPIWIAGTDRFCEGTWFWDLGDDNLSLIDQSQLPLRDADGLGNRANEDGSEENCMEMWPSLRGVNDRPCDKPYPALCRRY